MALYMTEDEANDLIKMLNRQLEMGLEALRAVELEVPTIQYRMRFGVNNDTGKITMNVEPQDPKERAKMTNSIFVEAPRGLDSLDDGE